MRAIIFFLSFATAVSVYAQGTVHFGNTATTLITTNDLQGHVGNISGAGNYTFGLYLAPLGGGSLTLFGSSPSGATSGRFDGGQVVVPFTVGQQVSFQVRGWSSFAGGSYEAALSNPSAFVGQSTTGSFTVPATGSLELFGTGPGQVGGFVLTPVPEPSSTLLACCASGLLGLVYCARASRQRAKS